MGTSLKQDEAVQVLVVEDEPLIAWMLDDAISELGFEVVGPFPSVQEAMVALSEKSPQLALLDVNLVDGEVYPLADYLHKQNIPIIFHTANTKGEELAQRYAECLTVPKPSSPEHLQQAIQSASLQVA